MNLTFWFFISLIRIGNARCFKSRKDFLARGQLELDHIRSVTSIIACEALIFVTLAQAPRRMTRHESATPARSRVFGDAAQPFESPQGGETPRGVVWRQFFDTYWRLIYTTALGGGPPLGSAGGGAGDEKTVAQKD